MSDNFRGAVIMTICMGAFVLNDAFVRLAGNTVPLAQILFLRGLLTTVVLMAFAFYLGIFQSVLQTGDKWLIFFRSVIEGLTAYFFLTAVMNMPFANVTAILQILPMTVTLAAAFMFKERVGAFRISLILIGFIGVTLIINPSKDGFNLYAGYALIAVALITMRDLITRKLSIDIHTLLPTVSASLGVFLFSTILMINTPFQPLSLYNSSFIGLAALFIIFGYYTAVLVMRSGEISFISPFRYSAIIFALLIGVVFFNEWPNASALLGILLVTASGGILLYRNQTTKS
ncbi:MAG: DMT family transporter [Alphaproteobacteria bacterium]|jgi:drug/metabolite transporter (DMT)-like permease